MHSYGTMWFYTWNPMEPYGSIYGIVWKTWLVWFHAWNRMEDINLVIGSDVTFGDKQKHMPLEDMLLATNRKQRPTLTLEKLVHVPKT